MQNIFTNNKDSWIILAINPLKPECLLIIHKNSVYTSHETHYISTTKIYSTLFRETNAIYCVDHAKCTHNLWAVCSFNTLKKVVHTQSLGFKRLTDTETEHPHFLTWKLAPVISEPTNITEKYKFLFKIFIQIWNTPTSQVPCF